MVTASQAVGVAFVSTALVTLSFLWVAVRYRETPGSRGFALVTFGITLWTLSLGASKFVNDYMLSLAAYNTVILSAQLISIGWFVLAIEFTGWRAVSRRLVAALGVLLLAVQLVVWTNPLHHLFLEPGTTIQNAVIVPQHGPGFWVHVLVGYGLIAVGTALFLKEWFKSSGIRRQQTAVLVAATVPPVLTNAVTVFNLAFTPYDVTPFGFVVADILFAWALFRLEFLGVVPIARQTAMAEMDEAVVTVDDNDKIVDCNLAARALFDADDYLGTSSTAFFDGLDPGGFETVRAAIDNEREVTTSINGQTHHYLLSASPIEYEHRTAVGLVVVLRDITPIKDRERALEAREHQLDLFRQVLSRVLRHNLRNEVTKITGNADVIAARSDEEITERAEAIIEASEELVTTSEKARQIERILEREDDTEYDLTRLTERAVADVQRRFPETTFEIGGLDECHIRAVSGLEAAITNLVENAAEHNDATDPWVSISITAASPAVRLEIEDNGPGIPDHEISVLEQAEETALEHGSGVGLWLVDWVFSNADATIEFRTGEDGTTVSVVFEPETITKLVDSGQASQRAENLERD